MKIKTNDNVKILSGKDRGKSGKVIQVLRNKRGEPYVVVEGCNLRKKHLRKGKQNEKGRIIELAFPLHASNVMFIDPSTKLPTRIGFTREGDVKKRVAKRSGVIIS